MGWPLLAVVHRILFLGQECPSYLPTTKAVGWPLLAVVHRILFLGQECPSYLTTTKAVGWPLLAVVHRILFLGQECPSYLTTTKAVGWPLLAVVHSILFLGQECPSYLPTTEVVGWPRIPLHCDDLIAVSSSLLYLAIIIVTHFSISLGGKSKVDATARFSVPTTPLPTMPLNAPPSANQPSVLPVIILGRPRHPAIDPNGEGDTRLAGCRLLLESVTQSESATRCGGRAIPIGPTRQPSLMRYSAPVRLHRPTGICCHSKSGNPRRR